MKRKTGKMILFTGVLWVLGFAVCACGKTEEASNNQEPQVVQGEPIQGDSGFALEPAVSAELESSESGSQGTDSERKDQPEAPSQSASGTSAQWVDSVPNLEGDIKELRDGQLTVVEAITEATAEDLASGQFIRVWGSSLGSELKATQICIVKVA